MTIRPFESLSPQEVLALAVHVERANARRFRTFADVFRGYDADVAARFEELASEEDQHEAMLTAEFRERFGNTLPNVEEAGVEGVIESPDLDDAEHLIFDSLQESRVYKLALKAEQEAREFYLRAATRTEDPQMTGLYRSLAEMEEGHQDWIKKKLQAMSAQAGE